MEKSVNYMLRLEMFMINEYKDYKDSFYTENKERIDKLDEEIEPFFNIVESSLSGDDEPEFLKNNQNKNIVINFINGSNKEGKLQNISNFGIIIKDEEKNHFYYKHSIESYYINE